MDGQAFAGMAIDHGEHAQFAPVKQVVGHKVHAPDLVDVLRLSVWLPQLGRFVAPGALVPQRQALLPVEAVDPFVVVFEAFALEQDMNSPVSVVHARLRDLFDPHLQGAAVCGNALVAVDGTAQLHGLANLAFAGPVSLHEITG